LHEGQTPLPLHEKATRKSCPQSSQRARGKAVGEDAALQIFLERFAHVGPGAVVVALALKLTLASQLQPALVVLAYRSRQW